MDEMYDRKLVGKALKTILRRMNDKTCKSIGPAHICSTCKYRNTETYIDQQWGMERVWHNWCKLSKEHMELEFSDGNGIHFSEPCEYWEVSESYKAFQKENI